MICRPAGRPVAGHSSVPDADAAAGPSGRRGDGGAARVRSGRPYGGSGAAGRPRRPPIWWPWCRNGSAGRSAGLRRRSAPAVPGARAGSSPGCPARAAAPSWGSQARTPIRRSIRRQVLPRPLRRGTDPSDRPWPRRARPRRRSRRRRPRHRGRAGRTPVDRVRAARLSRCERCPRRRQAKNDGGDSRCSSSTPGAARTTSPARCTACCSPGVQAATWYSSTVRGPLSVACFSRRSRPRTWSTVRGARTGVGEGDEAYAGCGRHRGSGAGDGRWRRGRRGMCR